MGIINNVVDLRFSRGFEAFVVAVIVGSALLAGAKTINSLEEYGWILDSLDTLITVLFVLELVIRFAALRFSVKNFFADGWNTFDLIIVLVSLVPVSDADLVIVARILRLFRIIRMVSILPDLRFLIASFFASMPRLLHVGLLLFIIFYMYAVIGSTLFARVNEFLWGDVGRAMLTLFRVMTFEDWTDVLYEIQEVYWWAWMYFISFIFFASFAFLNMMIGVMVGVMSDQDKNKTPLGELQSEQKLESASVDEKLDFVLKQNDALLKLVNSLPTVGETVSRGENQRAQMLEGLSELKSKVESMTKGKAEKEKKNSE